MTPAQQLSALEQQLRDCHDRMRTLTDTLVHTRAGAAKSMVYASDLVRRALAEVGSLNLDSSSRLRAGE